MEATIEKIAENSIYLNSVIELGDKNSDTLGHFPRGAFIQAAKNGNIVVAIAPNGECAGYLLYRIVKTKNRASITHLCVDKKYRKSGFGRQLVSYLIDITKDLFGISLFCKRDYLSNSFWPHMGFQYSSEKPGRGRDQKTLSYYWYDHNHPSLFKYESEVAIQSKAFNAVMDANVFIRLYEDYGHPLRADWLLEDLALCITRELFNEINRDDNSKRRLDMLAYADNFPKVNVEQSQAEQISKLLRPYFPASMDMRDQSDLLQLSYAIASNADFFVTEDRELIEGLKTIVLKKYGTSIVSTDDLIVHFDELLNQAAYQMHRLMGSRLQISRMTSGQGDYIAEIFHRYSGEKKGHFRNRLSNYLLHPQIYETFVVYAQDQFPIAIVVLSNANEQILEVPLIKVVDGPLSMAVEAQLIFWSVSQAVNKGQRVVKITDRYLSDRTVKALQGNSFTQCQQDWIKFNLAGIEKINSVRETISQYKTHYPDIILVINDLYNLLVAASEEHDVDRLLSIEKSLWPLKISDANIPTFIVPIKPIWAMDLFDYDLGGQTLLGSDPKLILRMENVYYRSSHTKFPTAPSRVLWYVSRDTSNYKKYQGVMAIRACSYVEKVVVGSPRELFKQYAELGVYRWENVLAAADNNPDKEILAFRFSGTELFKTPVPLSVFKLLSGCGSAPFAPKMVDDSLFTEIYQRGILQGRD